MRRPGSDYSQSRSDQRSGWLSKADSGQQHLSRKSLWTGRSDSDAPLTHLPGTRCFVAQRPAEPDAGLLHLKDTDGFFLCEIAYPNGKANTQTVSILSNLWIGTLPWLAMHWTKFHVICYEPASSFLFHEMLPRSGIGGQSLDVPLLNTLVILPASVKVCIVILCIESHLSSGYSCYFVLLVILWLSFFFHIPFSSSPVSFSRWAEEQNGTEYLGSKWWLLFFSLQLCSPASHQASVPTVSSSPSSHKDLEQRICFNFYFSPRIPSSPSKLALLWW